MKSIKKRKMSRVINTRYRWFILATLITVNAVTVIILVSPATLIGEISGTLKLSLGVTTAITMVAVNIFVICSALLGGTLIDRIGPYLVWIMGLVLIIVGSVLTPLIGDGFWGMLAVRFIQGFGVGPIMATTPLVVAQWFEKEERSIVIGIQASFMPLGAILGMSYVPMVFNKTGSWQTAMAWTAVFCVFAMLLSISAALGPKPPKDNQDGSVEIPEASSEGIKRALSQPATWSVVLCSFCYSWTLRVFNDLLTGYLAVDQPVGAGLGAMKAGMLMSFVNFSAMIGAFLSGIIVEKIFRGRVRGLVMIGFIIPAIFWYSIKFPYVLSNTFTLSLFLMMGGFALSMGGPLPMSFVAKVYPGNIMGKIGGLLTGASTVGILAGLGAATVSLHVTDTYNIAINLVGIGAFGGFISAFLLKAPSIYIKGDAGDLKSNKLTTSEVVM